MSLTKPTNWIAGFVFGVLLISGSAYAQNPFGDNAAASESTTSQRQDSNATSASQNSRQEIVIDPGLDRSKRLVLEAVAGSNPQSAIELAQAVSTILGIDQSAAAKIYFESLAALSLNDEQMLALSETMGSDFFLRVHGADALGEKSQAWAMKAMEAVERESTRPERLAPIISKLSSEKAYERTKAFRRLEQTGAPAVAAMLEVFANDERREEFIPIRIALREFGMASIGPLLAASRSDRAQVKYEALTALAREKHPDAFAAAMGAFLNPRTNEVIRDAIGVGFQETYGEILDRDQALEMLQKNFVDYSIGKRPAFEFARINDVTPYYTVWNWESSGNRLTSSRVAVDTRSRLLALDRARDLFEIHPENQEYRSIYLVSYLDAQKRIVGPTALLPWEEFALVFPTVDVFQLDSIIARAIKDDKIAAAAGGCDLLLQAPDAVEALKNQTVDSGLVRAFQSGDHHLQFCALRAIDRIDPQSAYFGSSYAIATAAYLAGYGERPLCLVGHSRIEIAQNVAVALASSGVDGRAVTSSHDLFREATQDVNVSMVMISDTLFGPDCLELAQQLRMDWRTKRVPIAILVSSVGNARMQRAANRDAKMLVMPLTEDANSIQLQTERMMKLIEPWPLSNELAQRYAEFSVNWLKKILSTPAAYAFYEPLNYESQLIGLLFNPLHTANAIEMMGHLGTSTAQARLLDFASQSAAPIGWRQSAAESFRRAVNSRGIQLKIDDIKRQYSRYNSSGNEPTEVQRLLGSILDTLEHHSLAAENQK